MNKKGFTLIELLMVVALLILFGLLGFTLVQSSINAYGRITTGQESARKARLALDYLQSRIRQNDGTDRVLIMDNPIGEGDALLIEGEYEDDDYLWIMAVEGTLYECYAPLGEAPTIELCQEIVAVEGFSVSESNNILTFRMNYKHGDEIGYLDRSIAIRSTGKEAMR